MNGGFVVNTSRKGSGVPFDQALEQSYNRPAKVTGGIIGITRKKDAVALWGIIKHKKDEYVHLLKMQDDVDGELSVHHDFNHSSAKKINELVHEIEDYLQRVCSPFLDLATLKNVLTGEVVSKVDVSKLLCCTKMGSSAFTDFVENRLRDKTVSIHSTISKIKYSSPQVSSHSVSKVDIKDETVKALMFIEYGRHRGFLAEELLVHEITSSAFFLVDKDGCVKKTAKSQLGTELLKLCPEIDAKGPTTAPPTKAYIIDFMAMVRKISLKKLEPAVKTFNDFAVALTKIIVNAGCNNDEIHVVFDTYKEDSIKNAERKRRGKSNEMIVLDSISPNHRVPVKVENFWSSSVSKTAFQAFYVEWLKTNYDGNKPLYLGISPQAWCLSAGRVSPFPRLDCTHEEADDRMMFHVQDILSHQSGPTSLSLSSGDTDVFVCLLYHFVTNWKNLGLDELWLIRNSGLKRSILPLRKICLTLGEELIKCLPALHALTGCDTTSKIATKFAALNAIRIPKNLPLLDNFNSPQLTDNAIQLAETFLVKCLKPSTQFETFDELRIDTFDNNALKIDFEKTACTSTNIRMHIRRSYYQMQLWIQAPFRDATTLLHAEDYGFERKNGLIAPEIVITKPEGLLDPCKCGKCARKNVCSCRVAGVSCCKYCKCKAGENCKNPIAE